jgi:hypothetical protein
VSNTSVAGRGTNANEFVFHIYPRQRVAFRGARFPASGAFFSPPDFGTVLIGSGIP